MTRCHLIRSASLSGYVPAALEVGLDPRAMLEKAGLSYESLEEPDLPICLDSFLKLLEISAEASGRYDFGARAAIARGVPDLGPVSLLLREAETVEEALQTIISRLHLHGDGLRVSIENPSREPFISLSIAASSGAGTVQATEFCACGFVQLIRWLIGAHWKPQRVCFSHRGRGPTQLQRTFFQSPVCYAQSSSGVLIDRQTLQQTVSTSAPFLRRQARRYFEESLAVEPVDFPSRVVEVIAQMLPRDCCTVESVALVLGIHRRTLARRLERHGESYSSLLQRARREIAQQIAADMRLSLTDAAEVAGFQSLSAFSRWFRSTFGCSATRWRRQAQLGSRLRKNFR